MPGHRARVKPERPAALLQAPAEIDVITRNAERRIETANCFQAVAAKGHVATGQMFGNAVSDEDVSGIAGRVINAMGNECIILK
jgi:hypothetical protein